MNESFDWNKASDAITVPSVQGIAVYLSNEGAVVIRQQATPLDDDDIYIVLPLSHVKPLARALNKLAKSHR